ncbi:lipase family protein [Sphingomonas sp. KR3-1]|uniref:lipase family protein n=1 Tax=Sphingomonas sp. KR3-1 TaxID=3156611 RepID=UPI0032B433D5
MKRRLLYAASQAYQPSMLVQGRNVGWIEAPFVVRRETALGHRQIDQALVGRTPEGVVVAFRGSLPPFFGAAQDGWDVVLDWLNDSFSLCIEDSHYGGGVHFGFAESTRRLWSDAGSGPGVRTAIQAMLDQSLLDRKARRHIFVTGHSKGGALANLAAMRAARVGEWSDVPLSVATIAAARAGNADFAATYDRSRIACLRYEMPGDVVPHLPLSPSTPGWARKIAKQVFPKLALADYRPVGLLVTPPPALKSGHQAWAGSRRPVKRLLDRRGTGLEALAPAILTAHAICPGSGYDRLICDGERLCDHGEDRARKRA